MTLTQQVENHFTPMHLAAESAQPMQHSTAHTMAQSLNTKRHAQRRGAPSEPIVGNGDKSGPSARPLSSESKLTGAAHLQSRQCQCLPQWWLTNVSQQPAGTASLWYKLDML